MAITLSDVVHGMTNPDALTPRNVFEYMSWMAAEYSRLHVEAAEAQILRGQHEASLIRDGQTAAGARTLAAVSDVGIAETRLRAALKSHEEMIRALKKMGAYLSEESRNQY